MALPMPSTRFITNLLFLPTLFLSLLQALTMSDSEALQRWQVLHLAYEEPTAFSRFIPVRNCTATS